MPFKGSLEKRFSVRTWTILILLLFALGPASIRAQSAPAADSNERLFIVRLRRPSLVSRLVSVEPPGADLRIRARTLSSEAYEAQLRVEHRSFSDRISADGRLQVIGGCTYLINVVFIRGERTAAEALRSDPEVSGVFPSRIRYPTLDTAIEMIRADSVWSSLGGISEAGRGVKIGIVDSGIQQNQPMFRGTGLTPPSGFPKVDADQPQDLAYTNNKVIVARSFWRLFPSPPSAMEQTPVDQQGHGSRVASIAAGAVTESPAGTIEGVAPMAFLGNYKIFGSGSNTTTTSAAVAAAINQAALDGMDVINLSIGGSAAEPGTEPEEEAIANAVRLGIVVVAAAGNLGPDAQSVTFPGSSPDVITVGAVTNGRVSAPALDIGPPTLVPDHLRTIAYTPGAGVTIAGQVGPMPIVSVADLDPSEEACTSLPNDSLDGTIVLVKRGNCTFQLKADHVFAAGARAMVVYNNVAGENVQMGFETVPDSPSVMIGLSFGEDLRDWIAANPPSAVTALLRPSSEESRLPAQGDVVAAFSGRGPLLDGSLKPDLVAVGTDVYAATNTVGIYSGHSNGTSFATPMVSGAAALVRQLHPDWPAEAVKSVLVSTSSQTPQLDDQPAHLTQMGGGRLDLSHAAEVDTYLDPPNLSFGFMDRVQPPGPVTLTLTNLGSTAREYSLYFEPWLSTSGAAVSISRSDLVLARGQSDRIDLTLNLAAVSQGGTVEGFVVIAEQPSGTELRIPVWGAIVAEDPDTTLRVSQRDSSAYHSLAAAIQAANPGNLIEITDSGTYGSPGTLQTNAQGIALNGLHIRSRAGESPTIVGAGSTQEEPILSVSDLRRVTIEGLHFQGGRYGVAFLRSSGLIRDCDIEVDPGTTTGFGIRLSDSQVHVYDNRIRGTEGSGILVLDSDALVQGNRIGDDASSGGAFGGRGVSVLTSSVAALFDNRLQGGSSNMPGVEANASSLLLKGNQILGFSGQAADGVLVASSLSHLDAVDNLVADNGEYGVYLLNGAAADLRRNRLIDNASAGIRLESGALLSGQAETITGNGLGILVEGAELSLSDSVVAFSMNQGISSVDSSVQLINDTIFGNGGAGLSSSGGTSTLVANTIAWGHPPGQNLVGVASSSSFYNLTEDQTVPGEAADDQGPLNDPQAGDFSLRDGSPAIDAADSSFVDAGLTDLAGHERSVDGNGDGVRQVDIGALEYGSRSAPPLILPVTDSHPDEFIGLAMTSARPRPTDTATDPTTVALSAHPVDGKVPPSAAIELVPMTQLSRLLSELIGNPGPGWLEMLPDRPDLVGFTLIGDYAMNRLDGIALGNPPVPVQVLSEVRTSAGSFTRVYIVNPGATAEQANIWWLAPDREAVLIPTPTIPPAGRVELSLADFIGEQDGGYLRIESTSGAPLWSMELFGTDSAIGALPGISVDQGSARLYGPQLAVTSSIDTVISLINLGDAGTVTFEAFEESGQLAETRTLTIGAGGQWRGRAAQLFGIDELVGWLRVSLEGGRLVGSVTFSDPAGRQMASLPLESTGARESIFSHVAQTSAIYTGLTLLNPGSEPTLASIEVFDAGGTLKGVAFIELAAGEKKARLLPEWIPSLSFQVEGFVRVRASRPVVGFELFGSTANLAAVPQQVLCR